MRVLYISGLLILLISPLLLHAQHQPVSHDTGMTGSMRGLDVVSTDVIWVSGSKGEFSVSRDGGKTWFHDVVPGAGNLDFRDVQGFSGQEALLMSAGPGKASAIFRTTDGGVSWSVTCQNEDEKAFFDGMDFFDDSHGLLIGDPVDEKPFILETRDGGRNWKRMIPSVIPDLIPGEYAFAASGTSLDANPDGTCYLVSGGSVARIFRSADQGGNWTVATLPFLQGDPAAGAFSVARGPGSRVVAAGGHYQKMTLSGSNIALSNDGGLNWALPSGAALVPFMECIRWIDGDNLIACGPPGIWISGDTGISWHELSPAGFHTMDVAPGGQVIWLAGDKGQVASILINN